MRTFSIFLLNLVNILLPLSGTYSRPYRAVGGPRSLFCTRTLEGRIHQAGICRTQDIAVDTNDLDKLLLKYARALVDKDGLW